MKKVYRVMWFRAYSDTPHVDIGIASSKKKAGLMARTFSKYPIGEFEKHKILDGVWVAIEDDNSQFQIYEVTLNRINAMQKNGVMV